MHKSYAFVFAPFSLTFLPFFLATPTIFGVADYIKHYKPEDYNHTILLKTHHKTHHKTHQRPTKDPPRPLCREGARNGGCLVGVVVGVWQHPPLPNHLYLKAFPEILLSKWWVLLKNFVFRPLIFYFWECLMTNFDFATWFMDPEYKNTENPVITKQNVQKKHKIPKIYTFRTCWYSAISKAVCANVFVLFFHFYYTI